MINGCIFDLFEVILKEADPLDSKSFDPKLVTPDDLSDGFFVFLKELKNKGIQVSVVSNQPHLKEVLDRLRITHLINVYLSKDQVENSVLDLYQSAAALMNLKPHEILLFKNENNIDNIFNNDTFNVISVNSGNIKNDKQNQITDFSTVKFNQLVSSISNFK
jgi:FMN phosphatase YigB (HAD superfamily)